MLMLLWPIVADAAPGFTGEPRQTSTNGAVLLEWAAGDDASEDYEFELQEADSPAFEPSQTRYRGTFASWFISGREDGTHYFRVRSRPWSRDGGPSGAWSEWSPTKTVVVEHHDLGLALGLLSIGALVFCATILTLVLGARASRSSSESST